MISLPDDLLQHIDAAAAERGTTRSGLIQDAARRAIGRPTPQQVEEFFERSRERFADAPAFESADLIRTMRDAR